MAFPSPRLTLPAFSICAEVHVPAPLNVYRHRADLIQEFGRRNATFWVSWKVPARGERRLLTRIASRAGRLARTVLRPEAFEARGFKQGPVDGEVLTRQQGFDSCDRTAARNCAAISPSNSR